MTFLLVTRLTSYLQSFQNFWLEFSLHLKKKQQVTDFHKGEEINQSAYFFIGNRFHETTPIFSLEIWKLWFMVEMLKD